MPIESSLLQSNRLVLFHCRHIPDRRPVNPFLDFVTGFLWEFAERLPGNMMQRAVVKVLRNILAVCLLQPHAVKLSKQLYHSFLLLPRV